MAAMKVIMGAVLICLLAVAAESTITCSQVSTDMYPCLGYLTGSTNVVPTSSSSCCTGVKALKTAATTTTDRQAVCTCLKNFASSISNINYSRASSLPATCGVTIPYSISPSTDCTKVT